MFLSFAGFRLESPLSIIAGGAMTGPNGDIFISYKAEDRARVRPLVDALMADGLSVWWDAHIGAGEDWRESIAANLDEARCVIVVWSKRSVGPDGRFVRDEAARAMKRHAYLPVTIDKVDPPLGFGETQCCRSPTGRAIARTHATSPCSTPRDTPAQAHPSSAVWRPFRPQGAIAVSIAARSWPAGLSPDWRPQAASAGCFSTGRRQTRTAWPS